MYDIYFDENDMHQTVTEKDEYWNYELQSCTDTDMYPEEELYEDDYPVVVEKVTYGHNCKKCGEYFPDAEANQKDGSLICYACRTFG